MDEPLHHLKTSLSNIKSTRSHCYLHSAEETPRDFRNQLQSCVDKLQVFRFNMESDETSEETFTPRNYQVELQKIALKQNTIIYLPTGSGKTFIGLMLLKLMSGSLLTSYGLGGKITLILVNSIALVDQHAKYIKDHTVLSVGCYTGEMKVDFWTKEQWLEEFSKYQVIIMTCQILVNILGNNFIELNKVNLMIFDECHRGVEDHSMRQVMKKFQGVTDPPRVLGLTATLLNGNCKLDKVMDEVRTLEVTYHSTVATVDGLQQVIGYSTNPKELFMFCSDPFTTPLQQLAISNIKNVLQILEHIKLVTDKHNKPAIVGNLEPLDPEDVLKRLKNLLNDLIFHIEALGTFGGYIACIAHSIQIERIKKHCQEIEVLTILNYVLTSFGCVKGYLMKPLGNLNDTRKIRQYSSDKVNSLFDILEQFESKSQEELCALIFVKRRFTAKVVHHMIASYKECCPKLSHIKSNFMVGYNNNPYNDTRESLYINKKNKEVLESFVNKEINVLIASNVLEEGVDIPKCTLVVKFDKYEDYRSYIQSKGRARHRSSIFYTIVEQNGRKKFQEKYEQFQRIENRLNDFLVGKTSERLSPDDDLISSMYNEDLIKPYYVDGPNSAHVDMLTAIGLLCRYCSSLPSNRYTTYAPDWYIESGVRQGRNLLRVVIILPIICPIIDPIKGPFMRSKKMAKRAAALSACIALHQAGELNDYLLPKKMENVIEDASFLFSHWPEIKDPRAGNKKTKRLHEKQIAPCLKGSLYNKEVYLHLIVLNPLYYRSENFTQALIYDMYKSPSTFGLLSSNPLPELCKFPIYDSNGTVQISITVNVKKVRLTDSEISSLREFHYLIFNDVLEILQPFLILDTDGTHSEMLLLVPVQVGTDVTINFNLAADHKTLKNKRQKPSHAEIQDMQVDDESYLHKIVTPSYRADFPTYIVAQVLTDKSARSAFPNNDYKDFISYYQDKYNLHIIKPDQPLLLVKGLSKRLNMFKPRGREAKRKNDRRFEESEEFLIPELVVKQDFQADLYIQAHFMPSILSRLTYLLRVHLLQTRMVRELGLNLKCLENCPDLELDKHLLNYLPYELTKSQSQDVQASSVPNPGVLAIEMSPLKANTYNKDFAAKIREAEYPWKSIDEPKDIDRELDVSTIDIEHYEVFISQKISKSSVKKNDSPSKAKYLPAITYPKDFEQKTLEILTIEFTEQSPNLCELYRAMTSAEANDIVHLERLEILGDCFLKLIASLYIIFKYPKYNEGSCTSLKGRLVSNKNLFYLAAKINLGGLLKNCDFSPKTEWMPPGFCVPPVISKKINDNEWSVNSLFYFNVPIEEQISGVLSPNTLKDISSEDNTNLDEDEESSYSTKSCFLNKQYVSDKTVADCVEALLGAFFQSGGMIGGIKFIEWIGIIPKFERVEKMLRDPAPDPLLDQNATLANVNFHFPQWAEFEKRLGYHFKNRAYLLQAMTHSSYSPNRITQSYERLEFLGDAVLDFLITCYIFEHCGYLDPGQVTDLRSALVNNNTFASLLVRSGFHKFILLVNSTLQGYIDKFATYLEAKHYVIDDEVLILLEEDDLNIAEYVDVPKVLGDVFEALVGAVFLDSGKDFKRTWEVVYKIMWREIDLFSENVPINMIRKLHECTTAYPIFSEPHLTKYNSTMISLQFMCEGRKKLVHGFGTNKAAAKRAAAKIALRSLKM